MNSTETFWLEPRPSAALSVVIFVGVVLTMAYIRLYLFGDRFVVLSYGLPLLICLWHRDRRLLWSMAIALLGMAAYKAFVLLPSHNPREPVLLGYFMHVINTVVVAGAVHGILNLTSKLHGQNAALERANQELEAHAEAIGRQNEELQTQGEELAQQNEEIVSQSEELRLQNEEMQQQSEELQESAQELQSQTEELHRVNESLRSRESLLQLLLHSVQGTDSEQVLLERICTSTLEHFEEAGAVAVVEKVDGDLVVLAKGGMANLRAERWPLDRSLAGLVIGRAQTAYVADLRSRPDLIVPQAKGREFRAILTSPLRLNGTVFGAVEVYSEKPHQWTTEQFRVIEWIAAESSLVLEARRLREELTRSKVQLEEQVRERTAKLQELVAELEHFSYSITHDMRAPLRAMQGFATVLQEECQQLPSDDCRDYLHRIITAAQRMDRLITDSLSYSRAVRQQMPLVAVDPTPLLQGMIESYPTFQPPLAQIEIAPNLPAVLANEAGLTQCFSNLLSNAVKFVELGKVPRVQIYAQDHEGAVRLCFRDNGIGIPKDMHDRLFAMFQRASNAYEGTGIGLALVRKVTERMGGQVGFESEPGQGSCFWIELNRAP